MQYEAPLINARIRKAFIHKDLRTVGVVGSPLPLTVDYQHLGLSVCLSV